MADEEGWIKPVTRRSRRLADLMDKDESSSNESQSNILKHNFFNFI